AGRHLARPAHETRYSEATLEHRALRAGERRLPAVWPGEVLGAVVGREDDDGLVVDAPVLQALEHGADDVIELRHARLVDAPAVLGRTHLLVLLRQVRDDVHARRVE